MIVTLLTDFGLLDHYVGTMKGVILGEAPGASIVDLGHDVAAGDIEAGAFSLLATYPYFPADTVHVVVVDPGVGSERRVIAVEAAGQRFVGPDNGVFSYLLDREPGARVFHVTADRFFRTPVSTTFHGRDIFAPVGAALARGVEPMTLGPSISDARRLLPLTPRVEPGGRVFGRILHVDRFGNCITNLAAEHLGSGALRVRGKSGAVEVAGLRRQYAGAAVGTPFLIEGSTGFIEISLNGSSAAALLGIESGAEVEVEVDEGPIRQ